MDERVYWIWLQQAFLPGSRKPWRIARDYPGGVREFCEGGPVLWSRRRDLSDREAETLRSFSVFQAEARLDYADRMGWQVLCPDSSAYPALLREIPNPPAVLYVQGPLPPMDRSLPIAVAGARRIDPEVEETARAFGYSLSAGGATVISGGAMGVDAAALSGALLAQGGRPVSVLPVSLDSGYVVKNARLRRRIVKQGGALVTEYFSQAAPDQGTFAVRNRLITGLAKGVVLIQAAQKSGTMLYAGHALDQNRDVFVYPGPEEHKGFAGSRGLIEDGAVAVTTGEEVLAQYGMGLSQGQRFSTQLVGDLFLRERPPKQEAGLSLADPGAQLSGQARQVYTALGRTPRSVQELSEETGLPAAALLGVLTELELEGLVCSHPGKRYNRNEREDNG